MIENWLENFEMFVDHLTVELSKYWLSINRVYNGIWNTRMILVL